MEKYGDLITNVLDLLSFLLVTPEIVRVIAPALSALTRVAIGSLGAAVGFFVFVACAFLLSNWLGWGVPPAFVGIVIGLAGFFLGMWVFDKLGDRLGRYASKRLFVVGIVLFFVSRLIAIYGSALKVG